MTFSVDLRLPHSWAKHRAIKWFSSYAHRNVGEFKAFEWQTDYFGWNELFSCRLDLIPTGTDHASVGFSLTILGFMVDCKVYDSRHWDHEENKWEAYDEESMQLRMARDERKRANELELAYQLIKEDQNSQTRKSVEEFLESPQGQAFIEKRVKTKLAEQQQSKDAKRARGEAYKAAHAAKQEDKSDV